MDMINPITYDNKKEEDFSFGVNFDFFTSEKASNVQKYTTDIEQYSKKEAPKRGRPRKEKSTTESTSEKKTPTTLAYADSYKETNNLLKGTILQADQLSSEIKSDIDTVRASKTLKNKYAHITNLTGSAASVLSTKIQAIRELDGNITQAHNLEIKRDTLNKNDKSDNDDMRMMDLYSAFINTPMGTYTPSGVPSIQDSILGVNGPNNITPVSMDYSGGQSSMTPELAAMRMETNPNIETVVKYDSTTGQRYFDVIDKTTMASVPNYPRPDNFLLDDTTIDVRTGTARNRNLDKVWPLVEIGNPNGILSEY